MTSKLEKSVVREEGSMTRSDTLALSQLSLDALVGAAGNPERADGRLAVAARFYLSDRDSGRPAWPYPSFLRGSEVQEEVEIPLEPDDELWRRFEAEAASQDVSPQQLAEHAAFYMAAEIDAGRITQRILDGIA